MTARRGAVAHAVQATVQMAVVAGIIPALYLMDEHPEVLACVGIVGAINTSLLLRAAQQKGFHSNAFLGGTSYLWEMVRPRIVRESIVQSGLPAGLAIAYSAFFMLAFVAAVTGFVSLWIS